MAIANGIDPSSFLIFPTFDNFLSLSTYEWEDVAACICSGLEYGQDEERTLWKLLRQQVEREITM